MSVYESIMQGLTEAVDYQQGKINARKTKLTIKPVATYNAFRHETEIHIPLDKELNIHDF